MPVIRIRNVKEDVYKRALYYKALYGCRTWGEFLRVVVRKLEESNMLDD